MGVCYIYTNFVEKQEVAVERFFVFQSMTSLLVPKCQRTSSVY